MTSIHTAPVLPSPTQVGAFRRDGHVLLRGFLSDELVTRLRAEIEWSMSASDIVRVFEKDRPGQLCRFEHFLHHPGWGSLLDALFVPVVGALVGEPVAPFKEKVNLKLPGGGGFRPHQDIPAYMWLPPQYHATVMVSLDPATPENGCLEVADRYRAELAGHPEVDAAALAAGRAVLPRNAGDDVREDLAARLSWTPLATTPNDLLVFDSFVPHRSGANESVRSRTAAFFTFSASALGGYRAAYYDLKLRDPGNPVFHVATPTESRRRA